MEPLYDAVKHVNGGLALSLKDIRRRGTRFPDMRLKLRTQQRIKPERGYPEFARRSERRGRPFCFGRS